MLNTHEHLFEYSNAHFSESAGFIRVWVIFSSEFSLILFICLFVCAFIFDLIWFSLSCLSCFCCCLSFCLECILMLMEISVHHLRRKLVILISFNYVKSVWVLSLLFICLFIFCLGYFITYLYLFVLIITNYFNVIFDYLFYLIVLSLGFFLF